MICDETPVRDSGRVFFYHAVLCSRQNRRLPRDEFGLRKERHREFSGLREAEHHRLHRQIPNVIAGLMKSCERNLSVACVLDVVKPYQTHVVGDTHAEHGRCR